jgi:hypothetical protein
MTGLVALDRLLDADRAALLTEVALAVAERFGVDFDECHNDSTTISFCGSYRGASGRKIRGRTAPAITFGHSKDHRFDLKQLQFILTVTADGNIPVAFRCTDGQHERLAHSHRDVEYAARSRRSKRLPVRGRFKTLFSRIARPYRSRGWTLRHRVAPHPPGRRGVPPVDPDQHP